MNRLGNTPMGDEGFENNSSAFTTLTQQPQIGQILGTPAPLENDNFIYRVVVLALSIALISSLGLIAALALKGVAVPEGVVALGSGCLGGLVGLLGGRSS